MIFLPARIATISAFQPSIPAISNALANEWPEANVTTLLDDSLARDRETGAIPEHVIDARLTSLAYYAASLGNESAACAAILFTCSAFGPSIARIRATLDVPVLPPHEGAFEEALNICREMPSTTSPRIGLLVTFAPSLRLLQADLLAYADRRRAPRPLILGKVVEGAYDALKRGNQEEHDSQVVTEALRMPELDALILGQFSMAHLRNRIAGGRPEPILATPDAAVRQLKRLTLQTRQALYPQSG